MKRDHQKAEMIEAAVTVAAEAVVKTDHQEETSVAAAEDFNLLIP
jgi:hypothetical protein